jgi:transcriptional regulator with XRE-family HTH domain
VPPENSCLAHALEPAGVALRHRLAYWGALIRSARRRKGWSLVRLATAVHLSKSTIHGLETGSQRTNPAPADVLAMARALDIPPDILGTVEPQSTLAKLVVLLVGYPPEVTEHLYELYKCDGPLFRDRRTPSAST